MTAAVHLLLYGAVVSWALPPLLTRLTARGLSPRWGIAAWLVAMAGVLVSWSSAMVVVAGAGLFDPGVSSVLVLCLEVVGLPEVVAAPGTRSVVAAVAIGVVATTVVGVGVGRSLCALRSRSRDHAATARIVGVPTARADVFVVTSDRPAAYCVSGRPGAIVVTSGAVDALDDAQMAAVIAHEDAHVHGRHHQLVMLLTALAGTMSRVPLFTRGVAAVGVLLEMCADDSAVRGHGARPLVTGLLALAGPSPAAAGGLAAASTGVAARAHRLLTPVRGSLRWGHRVALGVTIAATVSAPVVVHLMCHH